MYIPTLPASIPHWLRVVLQLALDKTARGLPHEPPAPKERHGNSNIPGLDSVLVLHCFRAVLQLAPDEDAYGFPHEPPAHEERYVNSSTPALVAHWFLLFLVLAWW